MKYIYIFFLLAIFQSYGQESEVRGVVTYFYNDYQGDKTDIGAKVYVIDSTSTPEFDEKVFNDFRFGNSYRKIYTSYYDMYLKYESNAKKYEKKKRYQDEYEEYKMRAEDSKKSMDRIMPELEKFGVDTEEKYEKLCADVMKLMMQFELLDRIKTKNRTIGASGEYSINLNPGTYYVIIRSKNRMGYNIAEFEGDLFFKKVKIQEDEVVDVSHNFKLD